MYPTARAIDEYHTKRKDIRENLCKIAGVSEYSAENFLFESFLEEASKNGESITTFLSEQLSPLLFVN